MQKLPQEVELALRRRADLKGCLPQILRCHAPALGGAARLGAKALSAKAQRARGGAAEIARRVFAVGGMPIVATIACIGAL